MLQGWDRGGHSRKHLGMLCKLQIAGGQGVVWFPWYRPAPTCSHSGGAMETSPGSSFPLFEGLSHVSQREREGVNRGVFWAVSW